MSSIETMTLISNTFIELTRQYPLSKITVADIVEAAGKNRKTFYYHFEDRNQLVAWIFRHDLGEILLDWFDPEVLVYEQGRQKDDPLATYPYYIFNKSGVRSLDHARFFEALARCFQNRRDYYSRILRLDGFGSLRTYLYNLYVPALEKDVRFILSNRYLKEESIAFLAEFATGSFLSFLVRQTMDPQVETIGQGVGPFVNIIHSSLENEIKEQQLRRML